MSLQFADTVILGEICYDMKLCTQWKKKLTHDRHNFKLTGWNENNKKEKYSVHKQQIISIYINYTTEKKVYSHVTNDLTDYPRWLLLNYESTLL